LQANRRKYGNEVSRLYKGTAAAVQFYRSSTRRSVMRKLIELLDDEDHKFLQLWTDANVAVFSSALLVGLFRKIVNLLFG
jgi:hypothetical protein